MNRTIFIGILLCARLFSPSLFAQTPATGKIYIGFLDDAREEMDNWQPGVAHQRLIRPAFEKIGSTWRPVIASSIPAHMTWTVAFDGKNLGQVKSQTDTGNTRHLTIAQTIITSTAAIPSVGAASDKFAGLMALGPGKARRPLVVISKPYVSDPDGWNRSTKLPDDIVKLVRAAFRRDFPHTDYCKDENVVKRDWKFPDSALTFPAAYASNKQTFLVEADLDAGDCGYVDDPNDPLSDPWFFVSADGNVRRIGSFMELLDAGDYDNDGRSELIFFLSQPEDTDGFILFDADLKKQASLIWTYH